jgi:hypothetical protein
MRACLLSLFVLVSFVPPAHAQERPMVAVLDFSVFEAELTSAEIGLLADVSRAEARRVLGDGFTIITQESIQDLLKSHGKTLEQCQGVCETETGKLLGAEYVVSGKILLAFGAYKVNLKVHRTSPPELLDAVVLTVQAMAELEGAVRQGTAKILGRIGAQRSTPAPALAPSATPTPAPAPAPAPRPRPASAAAAAVTITPAISTDMRSRTSWLALGLFMKSMLYTDHGGADTPGFTFDVAKLRWASGDSNLVYAKLNITNVEDSDTESGTAGVTANVGYGFSDGPSATNTFQLGVGAGLGGWSVGEACYLDTYTAEDCVKDEAIFVLRLEAEYEYRILSHLSVTAGIVLLAFDIGSSGMSGIYIGAGF